MAAASSTVALPGIAALPPTTARQIGSGQVLADASSVVKELIDNALDARAKSIFVDIAANTLDTIQVKDDGHGIPSEDRPLVCRRYCTSKIRDLSDLRDVGGKWLGFRGEALSSMADMSGALTVTTRVEGEAVAVKLKYGRDGELASIERDSHPVGTTVKVTGFFEYIPVRKQAAIKNAAKCLAKIRRLIQAYVLARPGIRFRLRVLKAKNNAGDFVYAPKVDASVEDAVLKIFGKDCAMQCGSSAVEADGFEVHALLPKPTAVGSKVSSHGSFVSVDARPVSSHRGTIKQLVQTCKNQLGQVNASLAGARDPFFCININCPPGSYDANVEPAKDDVLFENSDAILMVLDKMLKSFYPEAVANIDSEELSLSVSQNREPESDEVLAPDENNILTQGRNTSNKDEGTNLAPQPRWRSSMYGIDEDDLEFLQNDRTPIIDEEEGLRAIEVSNPWTIARMNAAIKPRQSASNWQLPSPAKSIKGVNDHPSPAKIPATPSRLTSAEPLTPQTSSRTNTLRSPLDDELERSIQRIPRPGPVTGSVNDWTGERLSEPLSNDRGSESLEAELPGMVSRSSPQTLDWVSSSAGRSNPDSRMASSADRAIPRQQPIRGPKPSETSLRQRTTANLELPDFQTSTSSRSRRSLPVAVGQTGQSRLHSNNKDIREWFGQSGVRGSNAAQEQYFTPINRPAQSIQSRSLGLPVPVDRNRPSQNEPDALRSDSAVPRNIRDYLQAYSERAGARSSSPTESQLSTQLDQRPTTTSRFHVHKDNSVTSSAFHAPYPQAERPSPASPHSNTIPAARNNPRTNPRSQSTDQMNAFFQSHLENALTHPPQHIRRTAPPLETSRPAAATKTPESVKPSTHPKPPLRNRTLSLCTTTTVETIIRLVLVRHDHLPKWDGAAQDAYHSFDERVSEERIAVWVRKLDGLLCALCERVGRVRETRGVLEEGVRRSLGEGVEEGSGEKEKDEGHGGVDDVVVNDDGDEYDDDMEEEMLMDL